MTPPPDTIDRAYELMKASFIDSLTSQAAEAFIAGEVTATKRMGMALNFNLINSRAVSATLDYRQTLERFGGTDITVIENGVAKRVFKPWLDDAVTADKEQIGKIISDGIREGQSLKQIEKALDGVFSMQEHNAKLTAYQETKALYNKGTMQRFAHENVERGIWHHMDPQPNPREDHQELDGKVFALSDPVWNLMDEPNCHCYCEPVIPGRTMVDEEAE
jgi:SPP1 gp7 family putative phage head morphogenesis protein